MEKLNKKQLELLEVRKQQLKGENNRLVIMNVFWTVAFILLLLTIIVPILCAILISSNKRTISNNKKELQDIEYKLAGE